MAMDYTAKKSNLNCIKLRKNCDSSS